MPAKVPLCKYSILLLFSLVGLLCQITVLVDRDNSWAHKLAWEPNTLLLSGTRSCMFPLRRRQQFAGARRCYYGQESLAASEEPSHYIENVFALDITLSAESGNLLRIRCGKTLCSFDVVE